MSGLVVTAVVVRGEFRLVIELSVEPGETVAIVGPNGSGKSTLVRAVCGLEPLTAGSIELADRTLDDPERRVFVSSHERRIGVAFQDALLFPHLDVASNVAFRLGDNRRDAPEVADWLDRVGLAGFGSRRVDELSGGEARRVAMARAFIGEPDLVILDEPFAGVDVAAHGRLRRVLGAQLRATSSPTLLITHDPLDAQALADRMFVLEGGQVTQHGAPAEVRRRPATRYVADLVGRNLIGGTAAGGEVTTEGGLVLAIADRSVVGDVSLTIDPGAITLHGSRPAGSARNTWPSIVAGVHALGDMVRVELANPLPLVVDVTPGAVRELSLEQGCPVWVAMKATSVSLIDEAG